MSWCQLEEELTSQEETSEVLIVGTNLLSWLSLQGAYKNSITMEKSQRTHKSFFPYSGQIVTKSMFL